MEYEEPITIFQTTHGSSYQKGNCTPLSTCFALFKIKQIFIAIDKIKKKHTPLMTIDVIVVFVAFSEI